MTNPIAPPGHQAFITAPFTVSLQPQERPQIKADQVLVHQHWSLISPGTELAFYEGTHPRLKNPNDSWARFPFAAGYASVGVVSEVGAGVEGFMPGDNVYLWGGHGTWAVVEPAVQMLMRVPAGMDAALIPFIRFSQIAATAFHVLSSRPKNALFLGAGMIGNLAAQIFRAKGIPQVAVQDIDPHRLEIARACGLTAIDGQSSDASRQRETFFGPAGPEVVIEATGIPALIRTASELVMRGGQVILLGSPRGELSFDFYKDIHCRGLRMIGAHESMLPLLPVEGGVDKQQVSRCMLDLMQAGDLQVAPLATHRLKPEEIDFAYRELGKRGKAMGVVIDWRAS